MHALFLVMVGVLHIPTQDDRMQIVMLHAHDMTDGVAVALKLLMKEHLLCRDVKDRRPRATGAWPRAVSPMRRV